MINRAKGKQITWRNGDACAKQASHAKSVSPVAAKYYAGRFKQDGDVSP